jgi:hypothetical protein
VLVRRGELIFAWVGGTVIGVDAGVVVSPEQVSLGVLVGAVRGMRSMTRSRWAGLGRNGRMGNCRRMWWRI